MVRVSTAPISGNGTSETVAAQIVKAPKERQINLPPVDLVILEAEIIGLTSLITNKMSADRIAAIQAKQNGEALEGRKPRNPEQIFRDACHVISGDPVHDFEHCRFGFNALGVKEAMADAGMRHAGEKKAVLMDLLTPTEELFEILGGPPKRREDVVRPQLNTTTIAYRPEYWPWRMNVTFIFPETLTAERIVNVLQVAGRTIGIGAWRPAKKGIHGTFALGNVQLREV